MDKITKELLEQVADLHEIPAGAYNIRKDGELYGRNVSANIDIVTKTDKPGIDIIIKDNTQKESVHIPVIISQSGLKESVYNDFFVFLTAVRMRVSIRVFTHLMSVRIPRSDMLRSTMATAKEPVRK